MNREEHLNWCKKRALEYVNDGNYKDAIISMLSDLKKHPDTENHSGAVIGVMLMINGNLSDIKSVTDFINGFN